MLAAGNRSRHRTSLTSLQLFEVPALWQTHEAVPCFRIDQGVVLVGHAGANLLSEEGTITPVELPDQLAGMDEIHVGSAGVVATSIDEEGVEIAIWGTRDAPTIARVSLPTADPSSAYCVLSGRYLARIAPAIGRTTAQVMELTGSEVSIAAEYQIEDAEHAEVVAASPSQLLVRRDDGVVGDELTVYSSGDAGRVTKLRSIGFASSFWQVDSGELYIVSRNEEAADIVTVIDPSGRRFTAASPGIVGSTGGDESVFLFCSFDGTTETVRSASIVNGGLSFQTHGRSPSRKVVGRGVAGWLERGTASGIVFHPIEGNHARLRPRRVTEGRFHLSCRTLPTGATTLDWAQPGRPARGLIVHLHGGPESYEADEMRLFGLTPHALELGWLWRSLNYRGSRHPDNALTRSAWHDWGATFREDLHQAIGSDRQLPVVLAGWSFGGALAMAAADSEQVSGLILGGAMANLDDQVQQATALDPAHHDWFATRFSLGGADSQFFSGRPPTTPLKVLSFHGRDDPHCPYGVMMGVRDAWTRRGIEWSHHDLHAGGHFVSTLDEARLVRDESLNLLRQCALQD